VLGPEDAIEDLPFAHKDRKLMHLKARQQARQKMLEQLQQEDPSAFARAIGGHRPRAA
jgi:hypothetical protein